MNQIKNKFLIGLVTCFGIVSSSQSANIILDLGDVLFETNYLKTLWHIGPMKMAYYASSGHNPFTIDTKLFSYLDALKPMNRNEVIAKDPHGHILPQFMCDWLKGTISGPQLLDYIRRTPGNFVNWQEEILVRALAETIFNPQTFAQTRILVPEGITFVNECKQAGHKLFILSNWDPQSFALLQEAHADFFKLFDGIVISGIVHLIKPDPAIYQYLLSTYNLDPEESFLIDDMEDNIQAARAFGITGILYTKKCGFLRLYPNFESVRNRINAYLASKKLIAPIQQIGNAHHHN